MSINLLDISWGGEGRGWKEMRRGQDTGRVGEWWGWSGSGGEWSMPWLDLDIPQANRLTKEDGRTNSRRFCF